MIEQAIYWFISGIKMSEIIKKKVLDKILPSNFFCIPTNNLNHYKYIQIHILPMLMYFISS